MSLVVTANVTFVGAWAWTRLPAPSATANVRPMRTRLRNRFIWSGSYDLFGLRPEDELFLQHLHEEMQGHAEDGQENQHGEHARDVEREVVLEDEVAESLLGADELADDRAEDAEDDRDVEAGEHERQRV